MARGEYMYDLGMGQYLPGESSHSVVSNHIYNQIM